MRRWLGMPVTVALALTACVTINVYFPAAEAKEAAKEFVEKVIGEDADTTPPPSEGDKPGGMAARLDPLMLIGISPAYAQAQPDITIKTPAIQAIQSRMKSRFDGSLRKHFDSGALGFSSNGEISVRDAARIALGERVAVNQAVAEQNRDAKAVYREIAVANKHPEWEAQIRGVFARQWVDSARAGWWYQTAGGWKQK